MINYKTAAQNKILLKIVPPNKLFKHNRFFFFFIAMQQNFLVPIHHKTMKTGQNTKVVQLRTMTLKQII